MMLNDKQIFVAGGKGLIGRAVVAEAERQGAVVAVADPDITGSLKLLESQNFDGFVNCSYPKHNHLEIFCSATETFAAHFTTSIVNLASIYGVIGPDERLYRGTTMSMPNYYSAIKGGIIAHSRTVAAKYGQYGVRVNCVSPGGVFDGQPNAFVDAYSERVPLGRMAKPEDVAGAVCFLLSDGASYITGQNIIVDGGLCASV